MHHEPVMLAEVLECLRLRPGAIALDGTLGLAGHSKEIARRIAPGGVLVATDWDAEMLAEARSRLGEVSEVNLFLYQADYREAPACLDLALSVASGNGRADAILLDLGLNNAQIEDPERGISFRQEGPLDMRMNRSAGEPASAWLNRATANEIERVLWDYGDERWAKKIGQIIADRRKQKPLRTTADLVDCVHAAIPPSKRDPRIHAATRTFQAVRIYINRELDELEAAVEALGRRLGSGGTMVVLSYHSGEDRAAKRACRTLAAEGWEEMYRKPLEPSQDEIRRNPKSRSAKMRAVRRPEAIS